MECLEKVNRREADFVAVDPEDMYVAFHMNNEDFSVFSEIRTVEEPEGSENIFIRTTRRSHLIKMPIYLLHS